MNKIVDRIRQDFYYHQRYIGPEETLRIDNVSLEGSPEREYASLTMAYLLINGQADMEEYGDASGKDVDLRLDVLNLLRILRTSRGTPFDTNDQELSTCVFQMHRFDEECPY